MQLLDERPKKDAPIIIEIDEEKRKENQALERTSDAPRAVQPSRGVRGDYDQLFQANFGSEWKVARAVCTAESGLNPNAVSPKNRNGTRDHGLCQINDSNIRLAQGSNLYDPVVNIKVAARLRYESKSGWNNWTVYRTGAYRKYL